MKPIMGAWLLLCLVFATGVVHAQGVGTSADIAGTISDPSGGRIANVMILAVEIDKGIQHATETNTSGEYRFAGLPPTTYDVTVKIAGFQTALQKGVILTVGATVIVDFYLKLAPRSEQLDIITEPPAVETQRASQANAVTQQYIADLPIDRRSYLSFTLLMPGISDSSRLASDTDFRVKQTPQSGLSFYGSNGRGKSLTMHGGEANEHTDGVPQTISQMRYRNSKSTAATIRWSWAERAVRSTL
jgi:hypothetical protein